MYNKTVMEFGFCDYQSVGKCYQSPLCLDHSAWISQISRAITVYYIENNTWERGEIPDLFRV
jgi:hypothetical protein